LVKKVYQEASGIDRRRFCQGIMSVGLAAAVPQNAALAESGQGSDVNGFYKDKTITLLVGVPGGSGGDVAARTLATALSERIPGKPFIVVKNLEGAGGSVALNYLYEKSKPDGLSLFYGGWNAMNVLKGGHGARFDPEKFGVIGTASNARGFVVRSDGDPEIKSGSDLVSVGRIKVGGRASNATNDMIGNLALKILGVDFRFIAGYRGMSKIAPAIYGGEIHGGYVGRGGYSRYFDSGTKFVETIVPFHHTYFDENGKDIPSPQSFYGSPSFLDLYRSVHKKEPQGDYWQAYLWLRRNIHTSEPALLVPPGTSNELVGILRQSLHNTTSDPVFRDKWQGLFGEKPVWNSTAYSLHAFENFRSASATTRAVIEEMSALAKF